MIGFMHHDSDLFAFYLASYVMNFGLIKDSFGCYESIKWMYHLQLFKNWWSIVVEFNFERVILNYQELRS